jgi:DNA-binding FadR family transcriptional regulator
VDDTAAKSKLRASRKLRNRHVLDKNRDYIVENQLEVGDRIPTEHELASSLQVSRVSVREATKALSLLGILESRPRRGTIINEIDLDTLDDFIGFHFASSNYSKQELVEARLVIEVGQLEFAMARMTDEDYRELKSMSEAFDISGADRKQWLEADLRFHAALLELGGNRAICVLAGLLRKFFDLVITQPEWHRTAVVNEHEMIADALYGKNLDLAQGLMRQHLARQLSTIAPLPDEQEQQDDRVHTSSQNGLS